MDIIDRFTEEICSICKGECYNGITFIMNRNDGVKCVNYIKDENKITKPEKQLSVTAEKRRPVMKDLI